VLLTPIYPPDVGGPASYVRELAQRLSKEMRVSVLGYCGGSFEPISGVDFDLLAPESMNFFSQQRRLWKSLKKHALDADLLYIQGPVVVGTVGLLFARHYGIRHQLKFVGDLAWEVASSRGETKVALEGWHKSEKKHPRTWLLYWLQKWNLRHAQRILVPSMFLKRILMEYYRVKPERIDMVFNAFDAPVDIGHSALPHRPLAPMGKRLMTAGRLVPHKNVRDIILAFEKLPVFFTLDVYGSGPEESSLIKLAADLVLGERVHFWGNVGRDELLKALEEHDLFVLYSDYEGLPHSLLEAFGKNCPVLASDIPGTDEVAKHGITAVLCPPRSPERLAASILDLAKDPEKRRRLTQNARAILLKDHSWETHLNALRNGISYKL
jgi:glycosyltransferase involved in cell wall biosynthesis